MDDDPLQRLLDDARLDEGRRQRLARQHESRAASEEAAFAGALVDLADSGVEVRLVTTSGTIHLGRLGLVATDFVVVVADGREIWCALGQVAMVQAAGPRASGPARAATDLLLVEALGRLAEERPRVVVTCTGGERVTGRLDAVGADLVTLGLDSGAAAYVPVSSLESVLRSG